MLGLFLRGLGMGSAGVALAGTNASAGVAAGRLRDWNDKEETKLQSDVGDVFSACASLYCTYTVLSMSSRPIAMRAGMSIPAAAAAGLLARWAYEKSDAPITGVVDAAKALLH